MSKMNFDELFKLWTKFMEDQEDVFFISGSHGWTKQEFIDKMKSDADMAIEYHNVIKPLIDGGYMYLN